MRKTAVAVRREVTFAVLSDGMSRSAGWDRMAVIIDTQIANATIATDICGIQKSGAAKRLDL